MATPMGDVTLSSAPGQAPVGNPPARVWRPRPQLLIAHDPPHVFLHRQQRRRRPTQHHLSVAPMRDTPGTLTDAGNGRFDDIRRRQTTPQVAGQLQAVAREHLLQTFQQARGGRGIFVFQPLGQLLELGHALVGRQTESSFHRRPDVLLAVLGQISQHVANLVVAAPLDGIFVPEDLIDSRPQAFAAIDDKQSSALGVQSPSRAYRPL